MGKIESLVGLIVRFSPFGAVNFHSLSGEQVTAETNVMGKGGKRAHLIPETGDIRVPTGATVTIFTEGTRIKIMDFWEREGHTDGATVKEGDYPPVRVEPESPMVDLITGIYWFFNH